MFEWVTGETRDSIYVCVFVYMCVRGFCDLWRLSKEKEKKKQEVDSATSYKIMQTSVKSAVC